MSERLEKRKVIEKGLKEIRESLSISLKEFEFFVNSILKKWKKEEDYYRYIEDYIYTVSYNHYKRFGSYVSVNRMLYLLKVYKNVDIDNLTLRYHYAGLIKKINRRVATRIYREKQKKKIYFERFLLKLVDYNKKGYVSKVCADNLSLFFLGYLLEEINNNSFNNSIIFSIEDLLHEAKFAFPEKIFDISLLSNFLCRFGSEISDDDIKIFFSSFFNLIVNPES